LERVNGWGGGLAGDDSASDQDFGAAMRRFSGAVTLIATAHDGQRSALTATAVYSLAMSPPRLLTCVNRHGRTFELLETESANVDQRSGVEQKELARRFAGMLGARRDDHFVYGTWRIEATGAPVLVDGLRRSIAC
jgi:flavin reductase (DIM6/NTAB) family NADH-FMN oxidoreductase RutF